MSGTEQETVKVIRIEPYQGVWFFLSYRLLSENMTF
jgi:hypothetical protein